MFFNYIIKRCSINYENIIVFGKKNRFFWDFSNSNKVIKALRKFMQKHRAQFEGLNFLNAVCDDIEKTFLINYTSQITVDEAIEKIKRNTGFYK